MATGVTKNVTLLPYATKEIDVHEFLDNNNLTKLNGFSVTVRREGTPLPICVYWASYNIQNFPSASGTATADAGKAGRGAIFAGDGKDVVSGDVFDLVNVQDVITEVAVWFDAE